jgi:hypothetical protein
MPAEQGVQIREEQECQLELEVRVEFGGTPRYYSVGSTSHQAERRQFAYKYVQT